MDQKLPVRNLGCSEKMLFEEAGEFINGEEEVAPTAQVGFTARKVHGLAHDGLVAAAEGDGFIALAKGTDEAPDAFGLLACGVDDVAGL